MPDDNVCDNTYAAIAAMNTRQKQTAKYKKAPIKGLFSFSEIHLKYVWWLHRDLNLGHQHYELSAYALF